MPHGQKSEPKGERRIVSHQGDIKFRGTTGLRQDMREYNQALEESEEYVTKQCEGELAEFKRAQKKLDEKLRSVMDSEQMQGYEKAIEKANAKATHSMKKVQREFTQMQYDIEDNDSIEANEKDRRLRMLSDAAMHEYSEMTKEFPSAMRAQMLSQLSGVRLLL